MIFQRGTDRVGVALPLARRLSHRVAPFASDPAGGPSNARAQG